MTKAEQRSDFRHIMKGTAVFGGTQVLTMLANIIKGKFVAIILGDFGMGISSLMQSALTPMQQLFSCGLPTSGVKDIAAETDPQRKAQTVLTFRRLLTTLAIAGTIVMIVCSSIFSISTFGDDKYTRWFIEMSIALLFFILASGESAVLQGYRRLKALATCNVVGPLCGLFLGVPLYFFYGIEGIVPAMILMSGITYAATRYSTRSIYIPKQQQTWRETLNRGKNMLILGAAMMIAAVIGTLVTYFVNTYIRKYGSIADVGLFQAANSITLQCTTMVFTAMATDYFPNLSSILAKNGETQELVEHEGEIVLLIIAPLTILLILFSPLAVRILLTAKFDAIIPLLRLIAISFIGRAVCFPLDYVCMAKGDKTFFFWVQGVWTNVKTFLLLILGYHFWGLIGLGYAVVLNSAIDIIASFALNYWRYHIHYNVTLLRTLVPLLLANAIALAASYISNPYISYGIMATCAIVTCITSYYQLDKRIGFKDIIQQRFRRS
ncbi:MAG: oligosaccharide flippase family protein [Bacteroidaceae bacterium]|nr:oligosaccharide flippase family protein [Bacteroidaceae bacterium]